MEHRDSIDGGTPAVERPGVVESTVADEAPGISNRDAVQSVRRRTSAPFAPTPSGAAALRRLAGNRALAHTLRQNNHRAATFRRPSPTGHDGSAQIDRSADVQRNAAIQRRPAGAPARKKFKPPDAVEFFAKTFPNLELPSDAPPP